MSKTWEKPEYEAASFYEKYFKLRGYLKVYAPWVHTSKIFELPEGR